MSTGKNKLRRPEKRALQLFERIGLRHFQCNQPDKQTKKRAKSICCRQDQKGASLLQDDGLFFDTKSRTTVNPKNYQEIRPDWIWQDDFIKVKDNIAPASWEKISIHAKNDLLRVLVYRIKHSNGIKLPKRLRFEDLLHEEQKMVMRDLNPFPQSSPEDRHYIRWSEITSLIPSPQDNFEICRININNQDLPVKAVAGLSKLDHPRLYYLDDEMMDRWDQILSGQ